MRFLNGVRYGCGVRRSTKRASAIQPGSGPATTGVGGTLEECGCIHAEDRRELLNHINSGAINATFQGADIGAIDASLIGQRLLGQLPLLAGFPQIASEDFSYIHIRDASALQGIPPRSMLYNVAQGRRPETACPEGWLAPTHSRRSALVRARDRL